MNSFNFKNSNMSSNLNTFKTNLLKETSQTPKSHVSTKKNSFLNMDKLILNPPVINNSNSVKNTQNLEYRSFKTGPTNLIHDESIKKKEFINLNSLSQFAGAEKSKYHSNKK